MQISENNRKRLIKLVEEEIEINPYDKNLRNTLKELKVVDVEAENKAKGEAFQKEITDMIINMYQKIGLLPTDPTVKITQEDKDNVANYLVLILKLDEMNRNFFKIVNEMKFKDYDEFSPYLEAHNDNIMRNFKKASKILDSKQ